MYRTKFLMALTGLALVLVIQVTPALATCTTHTITTSDGRMIMCTTCCVGNHCWTTCI